MKTALHKLKPIGRILTGWLVVMLPHIALAVFLATSMKATIETLFWFIEVPIILIAIALVTVGTIRVCSNLIQPIWGRISAIVILMVAQIWGGIGAWVTVGLYVHHLAGGRL